MERLIVITGLSGSGKSLAARCLEDMTFFCVDNLPVNLIFQFYELLQRSGGAIPRGAIVVDAREREFLHAFPETLASLKAKGAPVALLFFECTDEILKRRFSESRRPHPMQEPGGSLEKAIADERSILRPLRDEADRIIDTSRFTAHELRAFLKAAFGESSSPTSLNVHLVSFGFKYGVPAEADLLFDVRFLPNPYFVERLRPLNGMDTEVKAFLDALPETQPFVQKVNDLLDFLIPRYASEGKSYLTITIGCTGGKHRSVALAETIREHLNAGGVPVSVTHRDLGKE
ncbi:MAG TPA: RNase adapter RapZ [Candidatus Polarisedimenticolaceae bacterium]|nr:RNase adapter RapZ [Candidatus Polarisedimenticolaceae bacterium]